MIGSDHTPDKDANLSQLWARVLVSELAASGVREVCVAPGSRSTALVLAAEASDVLNVRVFLDERSAGFFALGLGKASGIPAVVITTSGTAVANLLPSVVEASQGETPLILLTADRPHRLRDADANQAIRQPGIFGEYVREEWDLSLPRAEVAALRHLRSVGSRAVASALGLPAGPVHINAPFEKPLEPTPVAGDIPPEVAIDPASVGRTGAPWTRISPTVTKLADADAQAVADRLARAERPLLVAGPSPHAAALGPALVRLAGQGGIPLLADPLSGGRFGHSHGAVRVSHHDLFLKDARVREALEPDLIIRVGPAPTSGPLVRWLESLDHVEQIVIDGVGRWKDHQAVAMHMIRAHGPTALEVIASRVDLPAPAEWRRRWQVVDEAAGAAAFQAPGPRHEGHIAAALVGALPEGTPFFVSSSMPIRDVDGWGGSQEKVLPAYGNRGASGIDGIVSTALGVAAGSGKPAVALLGDLAFLHDSNGLLASREPDVDVLFVLINNDGGGIFHMLPVREFDPPFERLFGTPHGLDLAALSACYGIMHRTVDLEAMADRADGGLDVLDSLFERELGGSGTRVLEIRTRREENRIGHEAGAKAAVDAAIHALSEFEA